MSDTSLPYYRTIRVSLPDAGNELVVMTLLDTIVIGSGVVEAGETYRKTLGSDGTETFKLPTPDNTGALAVRYQVTLPGGKKYAFSLAYGAEVTLDALIAAGVTALPADAITELVGGVSADILTLQADVAALESALGTDYAGAYATLTARLTGQLGVMGSVWGSRLAATASIGEDSLTLLEIPETAAAGLYVVVGAYADGAELRQIAVVDGLEITLDSVLNGEHAANSVVLLTTLPVAPAAWFGAAESRTDNETPINAALLELAAYRGTLQLPCMYVTQAPIVMPSRTTLDGVNFAGGIHNQYASTGILSACVLIGQHNPSQNDNYTWLDLQPVTAGDMTLTCVTPADAAEAVAGKCIFVRSAEYSRDDSLQKPLVFEVVRVSSSEAGSGVIHLDGTPVTEDIANPQFAFVDGAVLASGIESYICDSPRLLALRVATENGTWLHRQAAIDADIDVLVERSNDLFICNALRNSFARVRGAFFQRCFESKTGMLNTVTQIVGRYVYNADRLPDTRPLIDFGEHNKRNVLLTPIVSAAGWDGVSLIDMQASHNQVVGGVIDAPDFTGRTVFVRSAPHDTYVPTGNVVRGVVFQLGAPKRIVSIGLSDVDAVAFTTNYEAAPYTLSAVGHGLANYWPVRLSTDGTLPAPLQTGVTYWVANKTADTFELGATSGAASIELLDNGSGTHTVSSYNSPPTDNVVENCGFGGTPTIDAIHGVEGTGNCIRGNRFEGGVVTIGDSDAFHDNVIANNAGLDGPNTTLSRVNATRQRYVGNTPSARLAGSITHMATIYGTPINSTTPNNVAETLTIAPGAVVYEGDTIRFTIEGNIVGINAGKQVEIVDVTNNVTLAALTLPTSPGGRWSFTGSLLFHSDTVYVYDFLKFRANTSWTADHGRQTVLGVQANGLVIELRAWVTNGADSIVVDRAETRLTGPGVD